MSTPTDRAAERKARRAADAEREREREARLRAAQFVGGQASAGPRDVLVDFPTFACFTRHGLALDVFFSAPEDPTWSPALAEFAFDLTRLNMRALYEAAPDWGWRDSKKRAELCDAASRYLFVRDRSDGSLVAFAVFRFVADGDVDVLYVYELQLTAGVQRKGLGKHLMVLMELIARRAGMQWVFLTVLRSNVVAFDFYTKLKYTIDEGSPSRSGDAVSASSHEILSKAMAPRDPPVQK